MTHSKQDTDETTAISTHHNSTGTKGQLGIATCNWSLNKATLPIFNVVGSLAKSAWEEGML